MNNAERLLVKKKVLMLVSKYIDTINNSNINGTYKDLCLSKKQHEEKLLQGILSANGLKACVSARKTDGIALKVTTQENAIKKTFDKRFAIPSNFDFFKNPVYPYGLKEDLIVRFELNSSEKKILWTGNTSGTHKLSGISLESDTIFDKPFATAIGELYDGTTSIPYTKVALIHYQMLFKKDTT